MTTINVILNDQDLTIVQNPLLASGDLKTVTLHADFSSEWDGYAKTAVFYQDKNNVYHAALDSKGECVIPWEAMKAEGNMFFGIFGVKNSTRKTSEVVRYRIKKGAWSEDTSPSNPTPDIYTQIMSAIAPLKGYGLGEMGMGNSNIQVGTDEELKAKKNNGFWAYGSTDNTDLLPGVSSKYVKGITLGYSTGATTQLGVCNGNHTFIVRNLFENKWTVWDTLLNAIKGVPTSRKINGNPLSADFNLSASDVGAAPFGFGLGLTGIIENGTSGIECTTSADVESKAVNGFWVYRNKDVDLIDGISSKFVKGITLAYDSGTAVQMAFCNYNYPRWLVREKSTKWGDWEWVNPPMIVDMEYRTTERNADKPVYAKRFTVTMQNNYGNTTSSNELFCKHLITNFEKVVRCTARYDTNPPKPFPIMVAGGGSVSINRIDNEKITVQVDRFTLAANTVITFDLYYTKTA